MKNKRTARLQVMVTPKMSETVNQEAARYGLSTSSFLELVLGNHFSTKPCKTNVNEKEV